MARMPNHLEVINHTGEFRVRNHLCKVITIYAIIHVISISYKGKYYPFELAIMPVHLTIDQVISHTGESHLRNHLCNHLCNRYSYISILYILFSASRLFLSYQSGHIKALNQRLKPWIKGFPRTLELQNFDTSKPWIKGCNLESKVFSWEHYVPL